MKCCDCASCPLNLFTMIILQCGKLECFYPSLKFGGKARSLPQEESSIGGSEESSIGGS
jgi:hypothetical protein